MSFSRPAFDDRQLRSHLERCGFARENLAPDFLFGKSTVPLLAFSHRPFDTRTACVVAAPDQNDPSAFLNVGRDTGAPLAFLGSGQHWSVWQLTPAQPCRLWDPENGSLDAFFQAYRSKLDPRSIYRAKTTARLDISRQLSFVDIGLLEMVESESSAQLCCLVESMILATREKLNMAAFKDLEEMDAQWLVQANFWLLAARLLHDKQVQNFKTLDLEDLDNVFSRVARHYGSRPQHALSQRRRKALAGAADILNSHSSLRLVSTETLARVYENVLITKETRKALGTHSTPAWLVNYIVQRLTPWVEAQPESRRKVYEPGCGHAPFLVAMLRLFSGMKPCIAMNDVDRHAWLQSRLVGAETDDFAREVARLSLTLADIPNPNGWELDDGDMFRNGRMESRLANADIIISNPPFETRPSAGDELFHVGQAAELLRRISLNAKPGTLVAYIMPQTILDSKKATALRKDLLGHFEWQEILRLPDKVFEKADVETAVIIGRKLSGKNRSTVPVRINHVWDGGLPEFETKGKPTVTQEREAAGMLADDAVSMLVPDLVDVWDFCRPMKRLESIADLGQGLFYKPETHPEFPKGQKKVSPEEKPGYLLGFFDLRSVGLSHTHPELMWMLMDPKAIDRTVAGYKTGAEQVVLNYAPVTRGPWRNVAYWDKSGKPVRDRFSVLRPSGSCIIKPVVFWVLLNSPIANAFTKSFSSKRDILVGTVRQLPIPDMLESDQRRIIELAEQYILAASQSPKKDSKARGRKAITRNADPATLPGFEEELENKGINEEHLKHLHWRLDAAILALYKLPPELERKLLDFFTGYDRVGVPFHQTEYYPAGFDGAHTLQELLTITADWEATNARRLDLIDLEYKGKLKKTEVGELEQLQHFAMLRRRLVAPFPFAEQEALIERLKWEGKWSE